jgi:carboxypeptidase C (cathepsin A)
MIKIKLEMVIMAIRIDEYNANSEWAIMCELLIQEKLKPKPNHVEDIERYKHKLVMAVVSYGHMYPFDRPDEIMKICNEIPKDMGE